MKRSTRMLCHKLQLWPWRRRWPLLLAHSWLPALTRGVRVATVTAVTTRCSCRGRAGAGAGAGFQSWHGDLCVEGGGAGSTTLEGSRDMLLEKAGDRSSSPRLHSRVKVKSCMFVLSEVCAVFAIFYHLVHVGDRHEGAHARHTALQLVWCAPDCAACSCCLGRARHWPSK